MTSTDGRSAGSARYPGTSQPPPARPAPPPARPPVRPGPRAVEGRVEGAATALGTINSGEGATTALPAQRPRPRPRQVPPPAPPAELSVGIFRWLSPLLALAAVALLPVAAATTDLAALDGWGLAKVLGPAAWASLLCAVGACAVELWSPRPRIPMLGAATAVLILCSFGMPSVVEPAARFTTAWLISGFVDSIAGDGTVPQGVDARFYWPAFFAQWAFFRDAGGVTQLDSVLRWFPPVIAGVWGIGVYALARSMLGGTRAPWVAAWLFLGLNWIEQDYFSPQAIGIVLMLTVLTFALGPLATRRTDAAGVPGWPAAHSDARRLPLWRRWLVAAKTPPNRPSLPPRQLLLIYFCASLCLIALAPEHQLTPFAIIGQLVLLAVVGRFRGRGIVLVAILAVIVYVLIAGREFWINQLSLITGSSDSGSAIQAGVADRLAGDTGQVAVKLLRILVPGCTWLLAIFGAWIYWRRRRDLVPIALAAVPMGMAAVQSYGGELFIRIVLYGLPILAILGADALRALVRWRRGMEYVLAVGMALLFGSIILIRGGNDAYMIVYPDEVAMVREVYATTPPGSKVVPLINVGPYALEGIGDYNRGKSVEGCTSLADDPIRCVTEESPDVLLTFDSVEASGRYLGAGVDKQLQPPGWSLQVVQELVASGKYVITYQNGYDVVLRKTTTPPPPGG